jgi:hypothetical protein
VQAGETVWVVELYAAHPAGGGTGAGSSTSRPCTVPGDVWWTEAASASLDEQSPVGYGFRTWEPVRRCSTSQPLAGPVVPGPVPEQQDPGQ